MLTVKPFKFDEFIMALGYLPMYSEYKIQFFKYLAKEVYLGVRHYNLALNNDGPYSYTKKNSPIGNSVLPCYCNARCLQNFTRIFKYLQKVLNIREYETFMLVMFDFVSRTPDFSHSISLDVLIADIIAYEILGYRRIFTDYDSDDDGTDNIWLVMVSRPYRALRKQMENMNLHVYPHLSRKYELGLKSSAEAAQRAAKARKNLQSIFLNCKPKNIRQLSASRFKNKLKKSHPLFNNLNYARK